MAFVRVAGPKTLCNACGVKRCRQLKALAEQLAPRKAAPQFISVDGSLIGAEGPVLLALPPQYSGNGSWQDALKV